MVFFQELLMSMSMRETLSSVDRTSELKSIAHNELKRPNAAVGQSGLMALYEAMFRNYGILVGQVRKSRDKKQVVSSLDCLIVFGRDSGGTRICFIGSCYFDLPLPLLLFTKPTKLEPPDIINCHQNKFYNFDKFLVLNFPILDNHVSL